MGWLCTCVSKFLVIILASSNHTVVHADVINDWNRHKDQVGIKEVPDDSKGMVSFDHNLSVLI